MPLEHTFRTGAADESADFRVIRRRRSDAQRAPRSRLRRRDRPRDRSRTRAAAQPPPSLHPSPARCRRSSPARCRRCAGHVWRQAMVATLVVTDSSRHMRFGGETGMQGCGEPVGSIPTMRIAGSQRLQRSQDPGNQPSAPDGDQGSCRHLAICAKISRPTVPWPATTSGSANGCRYSAPVRSAKVSAAAFD